LAVVSVLTVRVRRVAGAVRVLLVTVRVRLIVVRVTGVVRRYRCDVRGGCDGWGDHRDDGWFDHGGSLCDDWHGGGTADRFTEDFGGESVDSVGLVPDCAQETVRVHGAVVTGNVVTVSSFLLILLVTGGRIVDGVAEVVLSGCGRLVDYRSVRQAGESHAQETHSLKRTK